MRYIVLLVFIWSCQNNEKEQFYNCTPVNSDIEVCSSIKTEGFFRIHAYKDTFGIQFEPSWSFDSIVVEETESYSEQVYGLGIVLNDGKNLAELSKYQVKAGGMNKYSFPEWTAIDDLFFEEYKLPFTDNEVCKNKDYLSSDFEFYGPDFFQKRLVLVRCDKMIYLVKSYDFYDVAPNASELTFIYTLNFRFSMREFNGFLDSVKFNYLEEFDLTQINSTRIQ